MNSGQGPVIVIVLLVLVTVGAIYTFTQLLRLVVGENEPAEGSLKDNWIFRLSVNLLGYATIFLPGIIIFKYIKASKYLERSGHNYFSQAVRACFAGQDSERFLSPDAASVNSASAARSTRQDALLLLLCFVGLQGSYLTWGLLQEKVMTQEYKNTAGEVGTFKDSQFLVFINRILAFLLSGIYITLTRQPRHPMPLYKYVYCSFSNIMSSWCQYEALKFVSFPTQVLAKACKIIPVMIMGKIVSHQKYENYEYITALTISLGMAFFMFGTTEMKGETVTTFSGLLLLVAYLTFDSFTSNWQGSLFTQYSMSSVQMMCGVNLFSCLFTAVSLVQQGGFTTSINFMAQFPKFVIDCVLLSISSASGQLFIFFTISVFGPVVFAIIMTIRQGLAILLSCLIYEHPISVVGVLGIGVVFASIFLRIYCGQRLRALRRRMQNGSTAKV